MTSIRVTATLRESASLGVASRADYRQDTYDHVPGSVLRGALAAVWLRTPGAPGPDEPLFREVFEGTGTFGPLHSEASLPVPLSVWTHKGEPEANCTQLWWDEVEHAAPRHCPTCAGPLVQSKGQPVGRPVLRARTRVAIDPDTGVAADGRLFRRSGIAAGSVLTGWVTGPAAEALTPGGHQVTGLRFGGERSIRGLADITVEAAAPPAPETDGRTVILRLASPGVFVDRFGHPAEKPTKVELADALGVRVKEVASGRERTRWTRWTEVGGWHMASGLPKPRDRAVAAGSTYLVTCADASDPDRLAALATRGVGLRRREGFGALYPRPPVPMNDNQARATVVAIVGWPKWNRLHPLLRARASGPFRPDSQLAGVPDDPTLDERQRSAVRTLLEVTDGARLHHLLDLLGVPR